MSLLHDLLITLSDGQPHEMRELYAIHGRTIKPEEACRQYGEENNMGIEEKIQRGRMLRLGRVIANLKRDGRATHLAGTGLHRTFLATEKGIKYGLDLKSQQATNGVFRPTNTVTRRRPDPVIQAAVAEVQENLEILISDQWTDTDTLQQVSTDNITKGVAERAYLFYSRSVKGRWKHKYAKFGKNLLYGRAIFNMKKKLDIDDSGPMKMVRLKQAAPPKLTVFQAG